MKNTEEPLKRKKEEKIIMSEIRKLNCGLRVVLEQIPYLQSVTAGVWVKAGCVDESDGETGISHFIEHMMFKGTAKRTARQIASDADALGAQMNAFTSKESTCYYIKSLTSNVDKACEIIIDMLTGSLFDPAEMAKEKRKTTCRTCSMRNSLRAVRCQNLFSGRRKVSMRSPTTI